VSAAASLRLGWVDTGPLAVAALVEVFSAVVTALLSRRPTLSTGGF
jgi:hypothetical protein